jgi:hypothetical protein
MMSPIGPKRQLSRRNQMSAFRGKTTLTPRSFDDDPAMGFNRRKMEVRRRKAAIRCGAGRMLAPRSS